MRPSQSESGKSLSPTARLGSRLSSSSSLKFPRWPLWLLCLLFAQCLFDDRHAGTSTSVTNPVAMVTGFAILNDGSPAAGARVVLRKPRILVSHAGVPASQEVGSAVADSAGKFTVPLVFMQDVYMEIIEASGGPRGLPADSQEVHLRRWPNGLPHDGKMGTFRLEAVGSITGHIETVDTLSTYHRWVGVRGTGNFVPAPGPEPFRLDAVPAGSRELSVVTIPDSSVWAQDPNRAILLDDSVAAVKVKPRETAVSGPIFYTND